MVERLKLKVFAERYGLHPGSVRRMCRRGELSCGKLGRRLWYIVDDMEAPLPKPDEPAPRILYQGELPEGVCLDARF